MQDKVILHRKVKAYGLVDVILDKAKALRPKGVSERTVHAVLKNGSETDLGILILTIARQLVSEHEANILQNIPEFVKISQMTFENANSPA